jgi:hypothetical protein
MLSSADDDVWIDEPLDFTATNFDLLIVDDEEQTRLL